MADETQINDENLLVDLVREILDSAKKGIEKGIPCVVTKVTSRLKVTVRPLIKIIDKEGNAYDRDVIEGVPVYTAGAGDTFISFPVSVGNIGWLEASDRDISLFLQSYEASEPPTKRMHSFSDARFIPDIMTNITVASEDDTAMVLQTRDGTIKIALDQSEIRIRNNDASIVMQSDEINIATSSVTVDITGSSVTGVAPDGFDLNGFTIDASGAAESPVSVTAPSVIASTSLTVAGKEQADHTHTPGTYEAGGDAVTGESGIQP